MGERLFITCIRDYEWICSFLFIGLIAFSTSIVGNKTTLFVIGVIIFMLLGIRIGNAVFWNERKIDGWTGMLIPGMLAAIVTNIEHEYNQLHFWLIIVLTIFSVLYISAAFLTYCANKKGDSNGIRFFEVERYFGASLQCLSLESLHLL